jgi:hypothetical protein
MEKTSAPKTGANARGVRTKKGRWSRDESGRYHYRGRCPFNNAVCRLLNYPAARREARGERAWR